MPSDWKRLANYLLLIGFTLFAVDVLAAPLVTSWSNGDTNFCLYKDTDSGRVFDRLVPGEKCPESSDVPAESPSAVQPPKFSLFNEMERLPVDSAAIDSFFNTQPEVNVPKVTIDYRYGSVDTAEFDALISQFSPGGVFGLEIMGIPFTLTYEQNGTHEVYGRAGIRGDASPRIYRYFCGIHDLELPLCMIVCEMNCGVGHELYLIDPIPETPYAVMSFSVIPAWAMGRGC